MSENDDDDGDLDKGIRAYHVHALVPRAIVTLRVGTREPPVLVRAIVDARLDEKRWSDEVSVGDRYRLFTLGRRDWRHSGAYLQARVLSIDAGEIDFDYVAATDVFDRYLSRWRTNDVIYPVLDGGIYRATVLARAADDSILVEKFLVHVFEQIGTAPTERVGTVLFARPRVGAHTHKNYTAFQYDTFIAKFTTYADEQPI